MQALASNFPQEAGTKLLYRPRGRNWQQSNLVAKKCQRSYSTRSRRSRPQTCLHHLGCTLPRPGKGRPVVAHGDNGQVREQRPVAVDSFKIACLEKHNRNVDSHKARPFLGCARRPRAMARAQRSDETRSCYLSVDLGALCQAVGNALIC